jgi:hypothetical protein
MEHVGIDFADFGSARACGAFPWGLPSLPYKSAAAPRLQLRMGLSCMPVVSHAGTK